MTFTDFSPQFLPLKTGRRGVLGFLLLLFFLFSGVAFGAPQGDREALYSEVETILNGHTAFSWGKDCIVWMVAYPEVLVDPWVELRALEEGFSEEEKGAYKASFRRDLRLHDTEPVLVTFYVFGETPLSFAPFSDHIALVNSSNSQVPPLSYAENLDAPLTGIVQGFVFFPPQEGTFSVQVRGMAPGAPRTFVFEGMGGRRNVSEEEDDDEHHLIVRIPEKKASLENSSEPSGKISPMPSPGVPKAEPTPVAIPTEDPDKPPAYLVLPPKASESFPEADVVPEQPRAEDSSGEILSPAAEISPFPSEEGNSEAWNLSDDQDKPVEELPFPINRVRRVEAFLQAWHEGKADSMYEMLSQKSRETLSREAFAEAVLEDQFRFALKNPYTLKWEGEDTVKVVAPQKMLVMRVLRSKVLRLVLEKGAWYIAW